MKSTSSGVASAAPSTPRLAGVSLQRIEIVLAILACLCGTLAGLRLLDRGIFFDEFFTLAMTDPDLSVQHFFNYLKLDIHPALHFLFIWAERALGVNEVVALRASNLIGIPIVAWGLWFAVRQKSLTSGQAWLIASICATSTFFLEEFAETRPYFLVICASTALVLVWRVVHARIIEGSRLTSGLLWAWTLPLFLVANLNYFAMMLGGVMTAALLVEAAIIRRWVDACRIALLSLAAAAPALALLSIQIGHQPANFWIQTTPIEAIEHYVQFSRGFVLNNLVLFALGVAALFALADRSVPLSAHRSSLVLLAVVLTFAAVLFLMNEVKPLLVPRYLTPAAGLLIVAFLVLATQVKSFRWAPIAILCAALLSIAEAVITNKHARDGWDVSAARIAEMVRACPSSRVYAATWLGESDYYTLDRVARRIGHAHYQTIYGFPMTELNAGDTVPAGGACPNLIWAEHAFEDQLQDRDAAAVLDRRQLKVAGPVRLEYVSSGAILSVSSP